MTQTFAFSKKSQCPIITAIINGMESQNTTQRKEKCDVRGREERERGEGTTLTSVDGR